MKKINLDCAIIDANKKDALYIKDCLNNNHNIENVKIFKNAYDGLMFIKKNKVDLVFLNLETPYALASREIEKDSSSLPLMVITTSNNKKCMEKHLNKQILGCISKPLESHSINEFVINVLKIIQHNYNEPPRAIAHEVSS